MNIKIINEIFYIFFHIVFESRCVSDTVYPTLDPQYFEPAPILLQNPKQPLSENKFVIVKVIMGKSCFSMTMAKATQLDVNI